MKKLMIMIAIVIGLSTPTMADIDIKGYNLGMTFEQFQEHSEKNQLQTLTRFLRLEQPYSDGTIGNQPLDSVFTTINLTPVILTAYFNGKGMVDRIVASDWNHNSACIESGVWNWVKRHDFNRTFGDKACKLGREKDKQVDHDTLIRSLKHKFKGIEITPDTIEHDSGKVSQLKRFAYVEKGVRLLGYSSETDHGFRITLMKQSKWLKNKADTDKFRQKILNDI